MRELLFGKTEGKTQRRLQFVLLAFVLGLAAVASGCGGDDSTSTAAATGTSASGGACDKEIWVLLPDSASSPRWETDDRPYFDQAFNDAGIDHTIVNAEGDAATQQSQAEQAIAADAGVIVLTSIDTGSGGAIIDPAKEAGVDVIEYDRFNTGSSGGSAYVSFDNVQVGATMAEVLEPAIDDARRGPGEHRELNGGEEDNNAFLFRDGYDAVVEEHVDDGELEARRRPVRARVGRQRRGAGDHGADPHRREQQGRCGVRRQRQPRAAGDQRARGGRRRAVPVSGQDASAAGIQNILLGNQTMTVYKPIQAEAETAVQAAIALCAGRIRPRCDRTSRIALRRDGRALDLQTVGIKAADGKPADSPTGEGVVPYLALTPIGVTVDNIADTVIADNFRTIEEICTGDTADTDFCKENS